MYNCTYISFSTGIYHVYILNRYVSYIHSQQVYINAIFAQRLPTRVSRRSSSPAEEIDHDRLEVAADQQPSLPLAHAEEVQ